MFSQALTSKIPSQEPIPCHSSTLTYPEIGVLEATLLIFDLSQAFEWAKPRMRTKSQHVKSRGLPAIWIEQWKEPEMEMGRQPRWLGSWFCSVLQFSEIPLSCNIVCFSFLKLWFLLLANKTVLLNVSSNPLV